MSIQSEINRIAGAKSDIADAIEDKGVTVPSGTKLDGMANLIGQISGGTEKLNSTQAADAYDPTATYAVGDKVSYAGNVYSCISAISTPEAWDSTHWDQVDPIQDQVDDVRNTLSHKADVIYDTVSGDIASFPDGADGLPVKDLTVAIEPVQSGTGDPSPTNVRPISGWTGANVSRTGKNLLNDSIRAMSFSNIVFGGATTTVSGISATLPAGTYTFSVETADGTTTNLYVTDADTNSDISGFPAYGVTRKTFTLTKLTNIIVWVYKSGYSSVNDIKTAQIELSSVSSAYEPYSGTTIPISWQSEAGTVYGGTLDVTSGVLTVTDANIASYNGETLPGEWISDRDVYSAGATPTTGAQVVYKLATPQTYQLDPVTVNTLLGQNNIWSDTGAVLNCEYLCDTKTYVDNGIGEVENTLNTKADQDDLVSLNLTGTTNTTGSKIDEGTYFYLNGSLVKAKVDIAGGATFTDGTNYETVTAGGLNNLWVSLNTWNSIKGTPSNMVVTNLNIEENPYLEVGRIYGYATANLTIGDNVFLGIVSSGNAPSNIAVSAFVSGNAIANAYITSSGNFVINSNKAVSNANIMLAGFYYWGS